MKPMDLRLPSRARGASLVEYLLVVGLVALAALGAYSQFGASAQSLSGREAECVRTFSCGPGTDYPSAALPTEGAKATPAGDPLRAAWDNANGVLADAEDRVARAQAALEIAGGTRSRAPATPAIVAARAELAAAEEDASAAYASADAAGQAVLDRAYGDHYGFLARNWIDFKNTPSFVAGLGVGTYDGVVGMPAAIGATATAVWTWATTSAPPRDLVPERAQRIADRDAELSHELLRINDGAAANYEDGVWYGDKVLAGVVVGEGIGLAFKGAVGGEKEVQSPSRAEERRGLSGRSACYANCARTGTADCVSSCVSGRRPSPLRPAGRPLRGGPRACRAGGRRNRVHRRRTHARTPRRRRPRCLRDRGRRTGLARVSSRGPGLQVHGESMRERPLVKVAAEESAVFRQEQINGLDDPSHQLFRFHPVSPWL